MKNVKLNLLAMILGILAIMTSCGGPKEGTKELDISNAEVLGDSADVVSIVNGTYTLVGMVPTDISQTLSIKIKLRLEKPLKDKRLKKVGWNLEILDENGTALISDLALKDGEESKLMTFLTEGDEGDEKEFTFQYEMGNDDWYKKIMTDAVNIDLKNVSFYKEQTYSGGNTYINSEDEETGSETDITSDDISSSDIDDVLKTYSDYVDKYITFMKKAANGDMSAMAEYAGLLNKAQELDDKLKEVKDDMTTDQWDRFLKIQQKMLSAINDAR